VKYFLILFGKDVSTSRLWDSNTEEEKIFQGCWENDCDRKREISSQQTLGKYRDGEEKSWIRQSGCEQGDGPRKKGDGKERKKEESSTAVLTADI